MIHARWSLAAVLLSVLLAYAACDSVTDPVDRPGGLILIDLGTLHRFDTGEAVLPCLTVADRIRLDVEVGGVPVRSFRQITPGATVDTMTARGVEGETTLTFEILSPIDAVLFRGRQTVEVDADFGPIVFHPDSIEQLRPVLKVCPTALDLTAGDSTFWVVNQHVDDASLAWTFDLLEEPCEGVPCAETSITRGELEAGDAVPVRVSAAPHHAMRMTAEVRSETVGAVRFEIRSGDTAPDAPLVAVDDTARVRWRTLTPEGGLTPVESALDVLANDTLSGDVLLRIASLPAAGRAVLSADARRLLYTPDTTRTDAAACSPFIARDSLAYTIRRDGREDTAWVRLSLDLAARDDRAATTVDEPITVPVLANDDFNDVDCLDIEILDAPRNGQTALQGDRVRYTPIAGFSGTDSLRYRIREGARRDTAAVVLVVGPDSASGPVAADDRFTVRPGEEKRLPADSLLANDTFAEREALILELVGSSRAVLQPIDPCLVGAQDCTVVYRLGAGVLDQDFFTYRITENGRSSEAEVTLSFAPSLQAFPDTAQTRAGEAVAISVLLNDAPGYPSTFGIERIADAPEHGDAETAGEKIVYTPDADFAGLDRFTYTLTDGVRTSAPAEVVVRVVPVARDDAAATFLGEPVGIDVLANDTPSDPTVVELSLRDNPTAGAVSVADRLRYTPAAGFLGRDSLSYALTADGVSGAPATVRIDVAPTDYAWVRIPRNAPASLAELCTDVVVEDDFAALEAIRAIVEQTASARDEEWTDLTNRVSDSYVVPFALISAEVERLECACPTPASQCTGGSESYPFCRTEEAGETLSFFQVLDARYPGLRTPDRSFRRAHLYPYPRCFDIDRVYLATE